MNPVADAHISGLEYAHVDTTQVQMAKFLVGNKTQRIRAKARLKFVAPVVRLRGDLEHRRTDAHATSGGKILHRQPEIEEEVVAEQRQGLTVRDQHRYIRLHDRDLAGGIWLAFAPGVSSHAAFSGES